MNILDLKKINIIVLSLLLFLSMQIPVFASENAAEVKIPVVQVVENEAKEQAEEFSYVLTTNQSEAPMPKGSKENQYCWSMKKKETVEISIPVTTRGIYHYQIYQTTEPKEAYACDQKMQLISDNSGINRVIRGVQILSVPNMEKFLGGGENYSLLLWLFTKTSLMSV